MNFIEFYYAVKGEIQAHGMCDTNECTVRLDIQDLISKVDESPLEDSLNE